MSIPESVHDAVVDELVATKNALKTANDLLRRAHFSLTGCDRSTEREELRVAIAAHLNKANAKERDT